MKQPIKILHVDLDWKVIYILVRPGALIKSGISLETALDLLKNETFDLIISEPHHKAALHRQTAMVAIDMTQSATRSFYENPPLRQALKHFPSPPPPAPEGLPLPKPLPLLQREP